MTDSPEDPISRFRDLHLRTYEIELLISGALVFGLLVTPGSLVDGLQYWQSRLDGLSATAASYLFVYLLLVTYSLLLTFVLHLCLRGYWVALLGLESVWPGGWTWDKLKLGPYSRQPVEQMVPTLSVAIDRADDRASVVFAAGALLTLVWVFSIIGILPVIPVGAALAWASGGRVSGMAGFFVVLGLGALLAVVPPIIDRVWGAKIPPDSGAGRWFARVLRRSLKASPLKWTGPLQFVFQSRLGEKRVTAAMLTAVMVLSVVLLASLVWRTGLFRVDGWRFYDEAASAVQFDPGHYRDGGGAPDVRPTIDSATIRDAYVRLYLPYRPRRYNPLLESRCPLPASGVVDQKASAACLGGLHTVSLDDTAVTGLTWDFTREPRTDYVGIVTFIDVRTLAAGRHELRIVGPGRDNETMTTVIPFYRE